MTFFKGLHSLLKLMLQRFTTGGGLAEIINPNKVVIIKGTVLSLYSLQSHQVLFSTTIQKARDMVINPNGMVMFTLVQGMVLKYLISYSSLSRIAERIIEGRKIKLNQNGQLLIVIQQQRIFIYDSRQLCLWKHFQLQISFTITALRCMQRGLVQAQAGQTCSLIIYYKRRIPKQRRIQGSFVRFNTTDLVVAKVPATSISKVQLQFENKTCQHDLDSKVEGLQFIAGDYILVMTSTKLTWLKYQIGDKIMLQRQRELELFQTDQRCNKLTDISLSRSQQHLLFKANISQESHICHIILPQVNQNKSWMNKYNNYLVGCYQLWEVSDLTSTYFSQVMIEQLPIIKDQHSESISASNQRIKTFKKNKQMQKLKYFQQFDQLKLQFGQKRKAIQIDFVNRLAIQEATLRNILKQQFRIKHQAQTHNSRHQIVQQKYKKVLRTNIRQLAEQFSTHMATKLKKLDRYRQILVQYKRKVQWYGQEQEFIKSKTAQSIWQNAINQYLKYKKERQSLASNLAQLNTKNDIFLRNKFLTENMIHMIKQKCAFQSNNLQNKEKSMGNESDMLQRQINFYNQNYKTTQNELLLQQEITNLNGVLIEMLQKQLSVALKKYNNLQLKIEMMFEQFKNIEKAKERLDPILKHLQLQLQKAKRQLAVQRQNKAFSNRKYECIVFNLQKTDKFKNKLRNQLDLIIRDVNAIIKSDEYHQTQQHNQEVVQSIQMEKTVVQKYLTILNSTRQTLTDRVAFQKRQQRQVTSKLVSVAKIQQQKSKLLKQYLNTLEQMNKCRTRSKTFFQTR